MKKKDKVFVTGGTGFIGSYILRELLHQGYQNIHALRRKNSDLRLVDSFRKSIFWHEASLEDMDAIYELTGSSSLVIHAAGMVSFLPRDKDKLYDVNVQGTENIVNACLEHQIPRLIHISSVAALSKSTQGIPITEETKLTRTRHTSHYGRSKHLGEMEVWRGIAEGLEAVILNPSIVLGAGDWNSSSCRLFKQVRAGLKYFPPGSTGFVDVRDVARIAVSMNALSNVNQRYILNESNYSFKEIFTLMAHELGVSPPTMEAPRLVANAIVALETIKSKILGTRPVITAGSVRNAYADFHYDNRKIRSLGFTFTPIAETIKETCALWKNADLNDFQVLLLAPQPDPKFIQTL